MIKRLALLIAPLMLGATLATPASASTHVSPSKGVPAVGATGATSSASLLTTTNFWYNVGSTAVSPAKAGAYANLTIINPTTAATDHSLVEISVQKDTSSGTGRQIIEVGINRDYSLYGDNNPHLFVSSWVNGVFKGYNATNPNYVDNSFNTTWNAASNVTSLVGTSQKVGIEQIGTDWWVAFAGNWVGSFPLSAWPAGFPSVGYVQYFGEVASPNASPCGTAMGNGIIGTNNAGPPFAPAIISSAAYAPSGSPYPVLFIRNSPSTGNPYSVGTVGSPASTRSLLYGGPPPC